MSPKLVKSLLAIAMALAWRAEAQDDGTRFFPLLICSNRTYTNATAWGSTPVAVTFTFDGGREVIPITNLSPKLQARFHYSPQKAQEYLDKQAAIAVAKNTLGPAQTIRIVAMLPDGYFQIEAQNKFSEAYIHNLPSEILTCLNEINKAKTEISWRTAAGAGQGAQTVVGYIGPDSGLYGRNSEVNRNAAALGAQQTADAVAAAKAAAIALEEWKKRRDTLLARFSDISTITAYPTAYVFQGHIRQWEAQQTNNAQQRPDTVADARQHGRIEAPPDTTNNSCADYDREFKDAVCTRWYQLLENLSADAGKVVVEFRLMPDGQIINLKIVHNETSDFFARICGQAISDPAPYRVWTEDMRRDIPQGYRDLTFTFYYPGE